MLRLSVLLLILFGVGLSACAQQPFFTDDADVTAKRRFHFELSNQFSLLQDTAFPNQQQNALVYQLNYGLRDGLEISIDSPHLVIINARQTISPRVPMGVGDTNLAVKWNFRQERDTSRWPALTMAFAVEVPTGDSSTQLGSGVFDYRLIAIAQKTLSPRIKLRVNQGVAVLGEHVDWRGRPGGTGCRLSCRRVACAAICSAIVLGRRAHWRASPKRPEQAGQRCRSSSGANTNTEHVSIDFGVVFGQLGESPRVGLQIGLSIDF